ncbi:MAG: hypothetical protein K9K40_14680 [Desulfotignum sp.]|nr:hypothetical protein [Desulfotignum sp.]
MSLMVKFQKRHTDGAGKAADAEKRSGPGRAVRSLPASGIARNQAMAKIDAELAADLAGLKAIKSIKQKEAEKQSHLVPKYMPVVQTLKTSGSSHPLLGQILVWLFDIKDIPGAMDLASYCLDHDVPMPERFKRDLPTFLSGTVLEWAEAEQEAGRTPEPYLTDMMDMSQDWDLPDPIRAGFYRVKGLMAMEKEDYSAAVAALETAMEYGAKVKTALFQAEKKLESQADKA